MLVLLVWISAAVAGAADIQTITHGQPVELDRHLVPGKMVLFDFYADWCGPCRALAPRIQQLAERHAASLAVRKVDIIDWDSPVARQYRLSSIPHLKLYGGDGELLAEGNAGTVLAALDRRLRGGTVEVGASPQRSSRWPLLVLLGLLAVTAWVATRRGRRPPEVRTAVAAPAAFGAHRAAAAEDGGAAGPAVWFVMVQDSLEGPFDVAQLAQLRRDGLIGPSAEVRRRGDATWTRLTELLE